MFLSFLFVSFVLMATAQKDEPVEGLVSVETWLNNFKGGQLESFQGEIQEAKTSCAKCLVVGSYVFFLFLFKHETKLNHKIIKRKPKKTSQKTIQTKCFLTVLTWN